MYRLGCCIPGGSFMPEGNDQVPRSSYDILRTGYEIITQNGFSFAEAAVGLVMQLTDRELYLACKSIKLEVCNSFIPPTLLIVQGGSLLEQYVKQSMQRMQMLGTDTVVFGSGTARRIPNGMDRSEGMQRIIEFLHMCNEYGKKHNIILAIEPLNRRETNIITSVAEGLELVDRLQLSHIRLLADSFHMDCEREPLSVLSDASHALVHIHISEPGRKYPGKQLGHYLPAFSEKLKAIGYGGRISAECSFDDFVSESTAALFYMKENLA